MSQKQGGSKITQSFQMGKIKRKNSTFGTSGAKDFQLTEQQAQLIQSKLPKKFRLINLENGDLQKIRQQLRINSSKNIQQHQTKPQIMIEEKKIQKKTGGKIKRGATFSDKKYSQDHFVEPIQQAQEKHEKNKKELAYKKKASLKYNVELQPEIPQSMSQINEHSEKQIKKPIVQAAKQKNQLASQALGQIIPANSALPLKQQLEQPINNSYIPSLPNCQPRHIPLPPDFQYDGNAQINALRYMYGLGFKLPPEEITKLNEKQKNFCNQIVQRLKAHKSSQPFRLPVDPQGQGVPDYFHVVYNPMDLQTIHRKILKDKYKQISQFHLDVNTIILNSYKYNLRQTVYFELTVQFEDYYHKLLRMAEKNPQQFTKEYIPKERKKKPIEDLGERDFTEKTPIKQRKKVTSSKDNLNHPQKQKKSRNGKQRNVYDDLNISGVISQIHNQQLSQDNSQAESQFKIRPKQRGRQKDKESRKEHLQQQYVNYERSREKRPKQAVLKKLNFQKTQSLPQQKLQLDVYSQFHNTQSNNSNLMYPSSYNSYNQQQSRKKAKNPKNKRKTSPIKQRTKQRQNEKIAQPSQNLSPSTKQIITQKQNELCNIIAQRYTQQQNIFQNQSQQTQKINLNNQELPIQKQLREIINSRRSNLLNDDYNDIDQIQDSYYKDEQKIQDQGSQLGISALNDKNQNDGYKNNNMKYQSAHALDQQIQNLVNSGIYEVTQQKPEKIKTMIEPLVPSKPKIIHTSSLQLQQPQFFVPTKPKVKFMNTSINHSWQQKPKKQKNQPQKQINTHLSGLININNLSNIPNLPNMSNITNIQSSAHQQILPTISSNTVHQHKSNQITMYLNPKNNTHVNMMEQQNRSSQKYRANANINQQEKYITINNLNTHPVHFKDIKEQKQFIEEPKEQNKIKQQIQQSLAVVQEKQSKANTETVVQKNKIIAKPKKIKNKDKNGDDQYRASSQDEEYIANQPRYIKRGKSRSQRGKPPMRQNKDSSDDGNPIKRRRGRMPKKLKQQMSQYIIPKMVSQQQNQIKPSENKPASPVRNLRSFYNQPINLLPVSFSKQNIPISQQNIPKIQKSSTAIIQKSNIQIKKPDVTLQDKPQAVPNLYGDQIFIDKQAQNQQMQESFPFFD